MEEYEARLTDARGQARFLVPNTNTNTNTNNATSQSPWAERRKRWTKDYKYGLLYMQYRCELRMLGETRKNTRERNVRECFDVNSILDIFSALPQNKSVPWCWERKICGNQEKRTILRFLQRKTPR